MTIRTLLLAAASLGTLLAQGPPQLALVSPAVSTTAVIESIQFDGVAGPDQAVILERIAVRKGDTLSVETRRRIGRELNHGEKVGENGLTFSYKPGSRPGTATLVISNGC
ncbi:MAG: hypothetical protein ABI972_27740 [Acidobacteriota bacterium]